MKKFIKSIFGKSAPKKIRVLPQDITIEIAPGQTILEAALSNGIAYPHDCTVGTCASCKSKLKEGKVREATPFGYTLSKEELDAGYILACQAVPRDELTVIEIEPPSADLPVPEKYQAEIIETENLTHDILKVSVKVDRPLNYLAGQYANIKTPNQKRYRSYSFANGPQRKGRNVLEFYIRKVPDGDFTEKLFNGDLTNQVLEMEAPVGNFHLHGELTPMICIAGGSGLAPLISILEHARNNKIVRDCTLLFGARTQADLYQLDLIKNITDNWQGEFNFIPVLSHEDPDSNWAGARGLVTEFIPEKYGPNAEGYLCGPPPMVDAAINKLVSIGIPIDRIYYDKFSDGKS